MAVLAPAGAAVPGAALLGVGGGLVAALPGQAPAPVPGGPAARVAACGAAAAPLAGAGAGPGGRPLSRAASASQLVPFLQATPRGAWPASPTAPGAQPRAAGVQGRVVPVARARRASSVGAAVGAQVAPELPWPVRHAQQPWPWPAQQMPYAAAPYAHQERRRAAAMSVFDALDRNHDGVISRDEFNQAFPSEPTARVTPPGNGVSVDDELAAPHSRGATPHQATRAPGPPRTPTGPCRAAESFGADSDKACSADSLAATERRHPWPASCGDHATGTPGLAAGAALREPPSGARPRRTPGSGGVVKVSEAPQSPTENLFASWQMASPVRRSRSADFGGVDETGLLGSTLHLTASDVTTGAAAVARELDGLRGTVARHGERLDRLARDVQSLWSCVPGAGLRSPVRPCSSAAKPEAAPASDAASEATEAPSATEQSKLSALEARVNARLGRCAEREALAALEAHVGEGLKTLADRQRADTELQGASVRDLQQRARAEVDRATGALRAQASEQAGAFAGARAELDQALGALRAQASEQAAVLAAHEARARADLELATGALWARSAEQQAALAAHEASLGAWADIAAREGSASASALGALESRVADALAELGASYEAGHAALAARLAEQQVSVDRHQAGLQELAAQAAAAAAAAAAPAAPPSPPATPPRPPGTAPGSPAAPAVLPRTLETLEAQLTTVLAELGEEHQRGLLDLGGQLSTLREGQAELAKQAAQQQPRLEDKLRASLEELRTALEEERQELRAGMARELEEVREAVRTQLGAAPHRPDGQRRQEKLRDALEEERQQLVSSAAGEMQRIQEEVKAQLDRARSGEMRQREEILSALDERQERFNGLAQEVQGVREEVQAQLERARSADKARREEIRSASASAASEMQSLRMEVQTQFDKARSGDKLRREELRSAFDETRQELLSGVARDMQRLREEVQAQLETAGPTERQRREDVRIKVSAALVEERERLWRLQAERVGALEGMVQEMRDLIFEHIRGSGEVQQFLCGAMGRAEAGLLRRPSGGAGRRGRSPEAAAGGARRPIADGRSASGAGGAGGAASGERAAGGEGAVSDVDSEATEAPPRFVQRKASPAARVRIAKEQA